jgi:hypothetical protein
VNAPLAVTALAGLIQLSACVTVANTLRIETGARGDSLAFVLSGITAAGRAAGEPGAPIYGLSVVACGTERALWTVSADGTRSMPLRVVYGKTVDGFPTRAGPAPLTTGCYDVFLTGARPVRFDVDEHGAIHVREPDP